MKLRNVSASQVTTFGRCKRRWHWEKIKGFRTASTRAMRRGTAIHYALEIYLQRGDIVGGVEVDIATGNVTHNTTDAKSPEPAKDRTEGGEWWATRRYVEQVKHLLPIPEAHGGPKVMTEQQFRIPTLGGEGPPWLGFIDLLEEGSCDVLHRVNDYKTSSDIRRYGKTKVELQGDIQANSYAKFVLDQDPSAEEVNCRWIYLETRNKVKVNTLDVEITLTRSEVDVNWSKAMDLVREMVALAADEEDTLEIEPNPEACGDFGGCPHKSRCGLSTLGSAFAGLTTKDNKEKTMGFLKNLKKTMATTTTEEATGILSSDAATRTTSDAEAEEIVKPKKATKPKKTEEEKAAEKEAKAAAKAEKAAEKEAKAVAKPAASAASAGFDLYINTVPVKGASFVLFPELMADVMKACGGEAEFWALDFAGQKQALIVMAQEIAQSGKNIAIFSGHTYSSDVIPVLTLLATRVFTGVRL